MTTFDTFVPLTPGSSATSAAQTIRPRVLSNDYGGAYAQRRPDGRNTMLSNMKLVFGNVTLTEACDMMAFFAGKRGTTPFWYDPLGDGNSRKWICTEWQSEPRDVNAVDVTCTFQEVNDP